MKNIIIASLLGIILLFGSVGCFVGSPVILLPSQIQVSQGQIVKITAQTNGRIIKWHAYPEDATVIPIDNNNVVFASPNQGVYKIMAWTALGSTPSEAAICTIIVGQPGPGPGPNPPPPPNPGPGPNPPPPPQPTDPFVTTLQAAYAQETDPNKAQKIQMLAQVYNAGATSIVPNPSITTAGQLLQTMHAQAVGVIGNDLMVVRQAIQKELDTKLPLQAAAALDNTTRQLYIQQFTRVANSLSQVR